MSKVLRFIGFMAPLVAGAIIGSSIAVKVWPDLKEKSPWFWLATGGLGAVAGMIASRLLLGRRSSAAQAPKTDPEPGPTPAKTYEEWRKDLDRTVDENAPDFMPVDDFLQKWSDVPRSGKPRPPEPPAAKATVQKAIDRMAEIHRESLQQRWEVNSIGGNSNPNVIRYMQVHSDREKNAGKTVIDPCSGTGVILVTEAGVLFNRETSGPVDFIVGRLTDVGVIMIDGLAYVLPVGFPLRVNLLAGVHFAQAVARSWGPRACDGHPGPNGSDFGGP